MGRPAVRAVTVTVFSDVHNPGIAMHQVGEPGAGFLVVDADDPGVYEELVRRAAGVN
jgi:hypothetical protein